MNHIAATIYIRKGPKTLSVRFVVTKSALWSLSVIQLSRLRYEIKLNIHWTVYEKISSTKLLCSYFCNTVSHFTHFGRFFNWISFSAATIVLKSCWVLSSVLSLCQENCCLLSDPAHTHPMRSAWCQLFSQNPCTSLAWRGFASGDSSL